MEFTYRLIHWKCDCGHKPIHIRVGVSSMGDLIGVWHCTQCNKDVVARIPLEQLIADIPPPPKVNVEFTSDDKKDLRDMHIRFEE